MLRIASIIAAAAWLILALPVAAQNSIITYQGQLQENGTPYTGTAELEFRLFDQLIGGNPIGSTQARPAWPVEDGLFQVELDFGIAAFNEQVRYLEIRVDGTTLDPRQAIRPAPVALFALDGNEGPEGPMGPEGPEGASPFELVGGNAVFTTGKLGVGTSDPQTSLQVVGSATFGMGSNIASGVTSFVSGYGDFGVENEASGTASFVAGGIANRALGSPSFVGGGLGLTADGHHSFVAGGQLNTASGDSSFAAGQRANAIHDKTFVWSDSQSANFTSTGSDQFLVRADGGVGINTNAPETNLHVLGPSPGSEPFGQLRLEGTETSGEADTGAGISFLGHDGNIRRIWGHIETVKRNSAIGNSASRMSFYTRGTSGLPVEQVRIDWNGATFNNTGTWSTFSDERLKQDMGEISNPLDRLLALEGIRYRYSNPETAMGAGGLRMGFSAQQVAEVFPEWVDEDERGYLYLSMTGFEALTVEALRGLQQRFDERIAKKDSEISGIRAELADLQAQAKRFQRVAERNAELESRLAALESLMLDREVARQD